MTPLKPAPPGSAAPLKPETADLLADLHAEMEARAAAARAAKDHGTYRALILAVPPEDAGVHIAGLLDMVALGMNRLRAGAL